VGVNSRLDEMQAAVLRVKLRALDDWNVRRQGVATRYLEGLREAGLVLPEVPSWAEPVWHLFVVRSQERDALQRELERRGIATMVHYPVPPHRQGAYRSSPLRGALPLTDVIHRQVLSLPMGPHLTAGQVDAVIDAVTGAARTVGP
jgi:dTDP-4-amino-4,6-dideoxygalactose transaminase